MGFVALTLLVPVLGACDVVQEQVDQVVDDSAAIDSAMERVVREQPDPAAVQFRDLVQSGDMVCGDLNSKNLVGAYVGFKPFIYREFRNGMAAWQITGVNALGMESRSVDGCLFPNADLCHAELSIRECSDTKRNDYIYDGYPADQIGAGYSTNENGLDDEIDAMREDVLSQSTHEDSNDAWSRTIETSFGEYVGPGAVCEGEYWLLRNINGRRTLAWIDSNDTEHTEDDFSVEYEFDFDGSTLSLFNGQDSRTGRSVTSKRFPMRKTEKGIVLNGEILQACRN